MIKTIEEFVKKHPNADIVNYDAKELFDYGVTYRTSTKSLEKFRKINGKYIEYPKIQPYLKAESIDKKELFIIYEREMFQLLREDELTYKKFKKIDGISPDIYKDDVFFQLNKILEPKIIGDEKVCSIK